MANPSDYFAAYTARKVKEYGMLFDDSKLHDSKEFIPYFNSGERIRVEMYGETFTGTVGVTTGNVPSFLMIRRANQRGSSDVVTRRATITHVQRNGKYVPVTPPKRAKNK